MRFTVLFSVVLLFLVGCANYKILKPEPVLSSEEKGYIELKDKKNDFELKKGKKYFITFPAPGDNNFYLVLNASNKKKINSFLTKKLVKNKTYGDKIKDESAFPDTMSVFPIDKSVSNYYWLLDNINEDVVLSMYYRYAPQWRFKFENKAAEYAAILEKNRVDRTFYTAIGTTSHFKGFNFTVGMDTLARHTKELDDVLKQLLAIESIFPASIVNSTDEAYLNYKKLKKELEEEIAFQNNYMMVLDFFNKEYTTQGNPAAFIGYVEDFIAYFAKKSVHPDNVIKESQSVLQTRLGEVIPFYEQRLSGKDDAEPFDKELYMLKELNRVGTLYETAGVAIPDGFTQMIKYVNEFDKKSSVLSEAKARLKKIEKVIADLSEMPSDNFFTEAVSKMTALKQNVPLPLENHGRYQPYKCTAALNEAIAQFNKMCDDRIARYKEAEALVPQVNVFKNQQDYKGMLTLLKPNMHLDFLVAKYKDVDKLSIQQQERDVSDALKNYRWGHAESSLQGLFHDANFLNPSEIFPLKEKTVRNLEDSLYIMIDRVSRFRVNKFCEEQDETFENIDSLYADSVFFPAYDVKFSTGSKRELVQRKEALIADLAKLKENEFPAKAIQLLFDKFLKDPNTNGVLRARAIVAHGEHYKGKDDKTERRIAECNPWSAKWIVNPKEYRRAFALPLTDSRNGSNRYLLRLNVRIPTEAKFPVYDVNIKLPKELAQNAATEQWYETITLNKKPLKNEGRFSITAPTAANDYECQITPVQMEKDGNNYLDIYFNCKAFKVFPISVMAQKPIIKKN